MNVETLIQLLQWRAVHQRNETAYLFLNDGETDEVRLTYGQLDTWARTIAAQLQPLNIQGERVLLLFPASLDYLAAFFGCLYAGAIAVPVYPPHPAKLERSLPRIQSIAVDAQPRVALVTSAMLSTTERLFSQMTGRAEVRCLAIDRIDQRLANQWREPIMAGESLAFLQYTSGSTATPRGVMVSHRNLLHNHRMLQSAFQHPPEAPYVSWLPLFHDMGLIGNALQALYVGAPCILMAPMAFLQRPVRWLQAISRYKAATSGGPNFAYDLCVRQTTPEQRAALDLSHWQLAFNGAEPVRADTIDRFTAAFAPVGFRREAFYPCYGLAEATLFVAGGVKSEAPLIGSFQSDALDNRRVVPGTADDPSCRRLVSCGTTWLDQTILIVDPETGRPCERDQVGEIWIAGANVAQGYWNLPEKTTQTFQTRLADTESDPFLRSGDLGLIWNDQVFVLSRLKDTIIIRGRNHYPQDIEATVERSHIALRPGCGAACAVDVDSQERLVIVHEIERRFIHKLDVAEVAAAIRQIVADEHEVEVFAVVFLKTGTIPKTSSGKIQRHACRIGFLQQTLAAVGQWQQPAPSRDQQDQQADQAASTARSSARVSAEEIQSWLTHEIARRRQISAHEIDIRQPFAAYGLSSAELVSLSGALEQWLERRLSPTLLYDYPTVETLAHYLVQKPASIAPPVAAAAPSYQTEPIAVTGIGCRFPGAASPAAFWKLLLDGVDAITDVPPGRWDVDAFYTPLESRPGKMNTRRGGFLDAVDQFDPVFFNLSPREAAQMDPQQRLLLEVGWEALEHAGVDPGSLAGRAVGVFVGISNNDYDRLPSNRIGSRDAYTGTGNALSIAANRLSYVLDLRGPALAVDTACSSSLVAVHLACESIRRGESEMALVGGVNLILAPDVSVTLSQAQMLSPDGCCKTFDAAANGYVRGEGCAVMVLKPLSAAQRDGDTVLALIRGSAVNQDGRSNGLTAPNGRAQQAVIQQALSNAGVAPAHIDYLEAHGSGTALGDPIEIDALKAVLMQGRDATERCWIGSVKTNIGHLEAAAGMAGLTKVILALHHGTIPAHLHLTALNPHIALDQTPLAIPMSQQPWPQLHRQRFAGVSSFGFGGTNAHLVLEAAPETDRPSADDGRMLHLLTLSAKDEQVLSSLATRYRDFLDANPATSLADLCATSSTGRAHFAHRLAVVAESPEQVREQLTAFVSGQPSDAVISAKAGRRQPQIAFLFTGQGAQYAGMGQLLYATAPVFRQAFDACDLILKRYLPQSLLSVLYGEPDQSTLLDETLYTQPALFAVEYALARLWQSWGIVPKAVLGHSVGEYVAACIAGIFSLEDGLRLVAERSRLMQEHSPEGQMVAVRAAEGDVAALVAPYAREVAIAAVNGPQHCVISGRRHAIQEICATCEEQGVRVTQLNVSRAFHSPLMDGILEDFAQVARTVRYTAPQIPIVSNVTGSLLSSEMATPDYWVEHVRQPVRFAAGIATLQAQGYDVFIEAGPQPVLLSLGRQGQPADDTLWLPSLRKQHPDWQPMLQSLASLYTRGSSIDWDALRQHASRRLQLPTYPWQRQRYWLEPLSHDGSATRADSARPAQGYAGSTGHPLLGTQLSAIADSPESYFWEAELDTQTLPYLNDHRISDSIIVPMSTYVEMALSAATEIFGDQPCRLSDLTLHQPLILSNDRAKTIQLSLAPDAANRTIFRVHGRTPGGDRARKQWTLHASAIIDHAADPSKR